MFGFNKILQNKTEKKFDKLQLKVDKLKGEKTSLEKKLNDRKKEISEELDGVINEKEKEIKTLNDDLNQKIKVLKKYDDISDVITKTQFLNSLNENTNKTKFVDISLNKLKVDTYNSIDYNKYPDSTEYFLYIYLQVLNICPYPIIATKVEFDIENMFGAVLVEDYEIENSLTILPNRSIIISSNGQLRKGFTYNSYNKNYHFHDCPQLEEIATQNDAVSKLILKIKKLKIVVLINGKRKIFENNFINYNNKKNIYSNKSKPNKNSIFPKPIDNIKPNPLKSMILPKIETYQIDINGKRFKAIMKFINSISEIKPVLKSYSPLKNGATVFTDSYSLYYLKCSYLPSINVSFTTDWKEIDKENFTKNNKLLTTMIVKEEYPSISFMIQEILDSDKNNEYDDYIEFSKDKIFEQAKDKEMGSFYKTHLQNTVSFSAKKIKVAFEILGIEDDCIGYLKNKYKLVIFNDKNEFAIILGIRIA